MSEGLVGAAALMCRYTVGFVLVAAAIPKLGDRREFARAIGNYAILPSSLVGPVAAWLPRLELLCGLALLFGLAVGVVATAAAALLSVFAVGIAINLGRGRLIDCGCNGSVAPRQIGWTLVASDLALAAMAAFAALADPGVLGVLSSETSTTLNPADGLAIAMCASLVVLARLVATSWIRVRRLEQS